MFDSCQKMKFTIIIKNNLTKLAPWHRQVCYEESLFSVTHPTISFIIGKYILLSTVAKLSLYSKSVPNKEYLYLSIVGFFMFLSINYIYCREVYFNFGHLAVRVCQKDTPHVCNGQSLSPVTNPIISDVIGGYILLFTVAKYSYHIENTYLILPY